MKNIRKLLACTLVCAVGALQGCGVEVDDGSGEAIGSETQDIQVFPPTYDPPTCTGTVSTVCNGMHCCKPGFAITGVHVGENTFECRTIRVGDSGCTVETMVPRVTIGNTTIKGCPEGKYMKGFHGHDSRATCCEYAVGNTPTTRFVDGPSGVTKVSVRNLKDPWPFAGTCQTAEMHVCPTGSVLEGINTVTNWFLCAR